MNAENWDNVKDLLYQAMQLAPAERGPFLDGIGSQDPALRAEIESLLGADADKESHFLERPDDPAALSAAARRAHELPSLLKPGEIFEQRFLLVRSLGEGGMGQVWLAEQTLPVRRSVALKLIRAGMYDESVALRFAAERQSLAIMDHPVIAKVFEAGATALGQPYFVMEYVPGVPITKYCDVNSLTIADRIEVFIQTCEGVQHAHQKAIIHRDLKPANILVTEVDGRCVPRIIDFGIAKPLVASPSMKSPLTALGQFVGTPGYISPEQADLGGQDIDTRSDVYSLGVVLYVLLTGVRPFDIKPGVSLPVYEWLKKLRDDDPPRPSVKIRALREHSSSIAAARANSPRHLVASLQSDLDWIILKALDRDRTRRYATPAELAADLRRYLDHEPVTAHPTSLAYRTRRYARRHRIGVSVGALLLAILLTFSAWQTFSAHRLAQERERVTRERDRAIRATDLLSSVFTAPNGMAGDSVTARDLLDRGVDRVRQNSAVDPDARAQMLHLLARAYLNLGIYATAEEVAQAAYDSRLRLHGADDARTLESMTQVGWIKSYEDKNEEAEALERAALTRERAVLGPDNALTLETLHKLSLMLAKEGREPEASKLTREWLDAAQRKRRSEERK